MAVNPIPTYNNGGVLGTSEDELLVDDAGEVLGLEEPPAVLSWDSNVVCGTDQGEIVGLYDEGDSEVLGLEEPPAVLSWDSNVVCGTDQGEIVGLYDEGDSEVLGLEEPPAVLDWGGVADGQP